ncbi:hypothetical protein [Protofrankia coriariae]|uniref:hypothetical protein n=1 Tax=Protofrankia coriariae TaxID=1562887 RepID=UPI0012F623A2|nr:hypothetical protein [Protofrankia coriariae]
MAWEDAGSPTELLQIKHHQTAVKHLTDYADDLWRTLQVWMDESHPADADGPALLLVTTQETQPGSAVFALREQSLDIDAALNILEHVARKSSAKGTESTRSKFLSLSSSHRRNFVSRMRVVDGSPAIDDVREIVKKHLYWSQCR